MFNILLIKIDTTKRTNPGDPLPIKKQYTIATAETESEALQKAQYYSRLYQKKGLYNVANAICSHIVTYCKA